MPLKVSDGMGAWIHDFKKSDAPQFKGKSEKERRQQAIAAYMAAKKEGVNESDASWAAAKEKEKMDRLTPGDQDKISKIRAMLDREKARKANQANRASQNAIVKGHKFAHPKPTKEEVQEGTGSLKPGWMLKKDPELAKKIKDKVDLAKKRQATYGDKSAGKSVDEAVHRIGVTVSDPQHTMASMRKEKQQKFVKVNHDDKSEAQKRGEQHFKKKGYKVHDSWHAGDVKEETQIDEISADLANRYRDKAGDEKRPNASDLGISRKDARKAHNRIVGSNRALDRMYKRDKLKGYKEEVELGEETNFEVSVEGLPKIYMKGKSPGAVKADLRKLLRQQKSILDVQRITPAELKAVFRLKAQGKDDQQGSAGDEIEEATQQDKKPPFDGPYTKVNGPHKDQFGNVIKVKNMAKHLAKKGMKAVQQKKENVNEISGELAQRYHDAAVKAPAPHNKKDPIGHTLKRFASMQSAQDRIHRDALKKIGSKK